MNAATTSEIDFLSTYGLYIHHLNLVNAAHADGMPNLAAVYAEMAAELLAQYEAEQRIEKAAVKTAAALAQDIKDARYEIETSGAFSCTRWGKEARHEAGMYRSNLYLAIRNAVYFDAA